MEFSHAFISYSCVMYLVHGLWWGGCQDGDVDEGFIILDTEHLLDKNCIILL